MKFSIQVDNIKCGGCASQISGKLLKLAFVTSVEVDVENGSISGDMDGEHSVEIQATLASMGYPPVGSQHGLEALGSKAKSFVSCAIGTMSKED